MIQPTIQREGGEAGERRGGEQTAREIAGEIDGRRKGRDGASGGNKSDRISCHF